MRKVLKGSGVRGSLQMRLKKGLFPEGWHEAEMMGYSPANVRSGLCGQLDPHPYCGASKNLTHGPWRLPADLYTGLIIPLWEKQRPKVTHMLSTY